MKTSRNQVGRPKKNGENTTIDFVIDLDDKIWEKMPWETPENYLLFRNHYLSNPNVQSVSAAYRAWYLDTNGVQTDSPPPTHWFRIADGKTVVKGTGEDARMFFFYSVDESHHLHDVPQPVPTWKERKNSWQRHMDEIFDKEAEERYKEEVAKILETMRAGSKIFLNKLVVAVSKYKPGGESLSELSLSMGRALEILRVLYGSNIFPEDSGNTGDIQATLNDDMEEAARRNATKALTPAERIEAVAELLAKADKRANN